MDKEQNTGKLYIAKNKFGPDGITFPCKIVNENGIFNIFESATSTGQEMLSTMKNGDDKRMRSRIQEILQDESKVRQE